MSELALGLVLYYLVIACGTLTEGQLVCSTKITSGRHLLHHAMYRVSIESDTSVHSNCNPCMAQKIQAQVLEQGPWSSSLQHHFKRAQRQEHCHWTCTAVIGRCVRVTMFTFDVADNWAPSVRSTICQT